MTPRLLCELPASGGPVSASTEQSHYLLQVLRLNVGDEVEIFDGRGLRFQAKITAIQTKSAMLLAEPGRRQAPLRSENIWIFQGLPSGDKMDWIIEKAVELGVNRLSPMECERSIVKLSGPRLDKKMAHWRAEIVAACMQSQRDDLMLLDTVQTTELCLTRPSGPALQYFLDPGAKLSLLDALRTSKRERSEPQDQAASIAPIKIVIGPESGFSDREKWLAERNGFTAVSLGAQVLRTETAALVATAKIQAWLEVI